MSAWGLVPALGFALRLRKCPLVFTPGTRACERGTEGRANSVTGRRQLRGLTLSPGLDSQRVARGSVAGRVTHGAPAAPAPRLGSLGSPCTCTMVHLGSSAPNCTVHLGASELMRTRIKVLIRPLAPNRTVHLGASERLTVCVAQPGNGYTSARIAAKTFRLQLSYTKIKSG